ncbi:DUF6105 family protein [Hoeflea olei]|uniref:Uncharacterized protein n=1 Tax=Hoeflea olei TaxID=1480615 RepID=A0A1C1YT94_9HYPH|nr:DUF6105 family protein [Hoeflea olei]OCW56714.1 hypothetical protein AWJ14_17450 [Hoeflea olei]
MKLFLLLWILPIVLLGSWYGLSYYDINFGYRILSRDLHDLVFIIYGNMLGLPPQAVPPLVLKAVIVDSFLVLGFIVLKRRRRQIWAALKAFFAPVTARFRGAGETEAAPQPD